MAVSLIIQAAELLAIRRTFSDTGVWRWSDFRGEFAPLPAGIRALADLLLSYNRFVCLLWLQFIAAFTLLFVPSPLLIAGLLLSTIAVAVRWRGTFNGGSDCMTVVVLSALLIATIFPEHPTVVLGAIYYIALHSCLSYFVSGFVKLRSGSWREGKPLLPFLASGPFEIPAVLKRFLQLPGMALACCWIIIGFECLFPLLIFSSSYVLLILLCGVGFHLANAYLLGLNRFFFVWIATYPALLWCSGLT